MTYEAWSISAGSDGRWLVRNVDGMHMVPTTTVNSDPEGAFAQAIGVVNARKLTVVSVVPVPAGWIMIVG